MMWTLISLLVMIVMFALLRLVAWWGLLVLWGLGGRTVKVVRHVGDRADVSALSGRIRTSFPGTARLLEARLTPGRFTGLPLTLIVLAGLYVAALLGGLVEELLEADELVHVDEWINQRLVPLRGDGMVALFSWITDLGGSATLAAVVLVSTGLLSASGHGYLVVSLWLTLVGSLVTTSAGKYLIARQRPEFITEIAAATPSFPSGHATSAMAVYGFIAYIVARDLPGVRQRFEVVYWAAVLIGLVGFSRMQLSLHYASDVAAGFLVGGFWLLIGFTVAEFMRRQFNPTSG